MMSHFELLRNDDGFHSLLEPTTPAYTSVTVRRAFIVWLHCGQQNEFRHVCNYFHYLESMEEQLPPTPRTTSRLHELNLLSDLPPSSQYLNRHFPKLYNQNKNDKTTVKRLKSIKLDDCVFNLDNLQEMNAQKSVQTKEIIKTSQMIRRYCKSHYKSLSNFLAEFKDFTEKSGVTNSVDNILMYINNRFLKDDLVTLMNLPKTFDFLDSVDEDNIDEDTTKPKVNLHANCPTFTLNNGNEIKTAGKIRILINESRRKELNILSDLSIKESEDQSLSKHNTLLVKLLEANTKQTQDENDGSTI